MGDPADKPRYAQADLIRLREDEEFQRRVGSDEELSRLFDPASEDLDTRAELAGSLGMCRRIAGVDVPPVTLGGIALLTALGNEFVKERRDWSQGPAYQLGQLTEALFVLANGPKVVVPFADVFRNLRSIQAWRKDAASSPHIAAACMDAERKAASALLTWDAAVLTWGARCVRLEGEETLAECIGSFDDWVSQGLEGFRLFPQVQRPDEKESAHQRSPFGSLRKLRAGLSRALVRCALALLPARSGGKSR